MTSQLCPICSFNSPQEFNFCGHCGAEFKAQQINGETASQTLSPRAERRQVTVLFCDLVGSTEFSQTYDPEDLRRIIRTYQATCEPAIRQNGGFVSRFLGDGILAIFGYPNADEDDAINAVHSGLEMVDAVQSLDWKASTGLSVQPAIRVGISTGLVVAGDLIGKDAAAEEAIVGETPNLAGRIQSLAGPNTVLISARTRRLLGQHFTLSSLGKLILKGFRAPEEVWQVITSVNAPSRFEAMRASSTTTLINRHKELHYLSDQWKRCLRNDSRIVIISGESGIGKSRLAEAIRQTIERQPHYYLRFQCSPYHVNTALHPVSAHFETAAGIERTDLSYKRIEKLQSVLRFPANADARTLAAVSELLRIEEVHDEEFDRLSAEGKRYATYDALINHCLALSKSRPVLIVCEDIHWSDPTSIDLFEYFAQTVHDVPILVLMTCRSGFAIPENRFSKASHVRLERLPLEHSTDLVKDLDFNLQLPVQILEQIVSKADGIPLFLEELTNTLLIPRKTDSTHEGAENKSDNDSEPRIPDTLHDSLMARLDNADEGKRIAQIASTIGRNFSFELLARIAQMSHDKIRDGLEKLTSAGLVFAENHATGHNFMFKHALVRDTAYGSLLREERRTLHRRIAQALNDAQNPPDPELLAWHYTEAAMLPQAIDYWLRSGQVASQRSAHNEAVGHLQNGLKLLRRQAESEQRNIQLLQYLVTMGPNLIATMGSGSAETEAIYREAVTLSATLPESDDHFTAHWGWWRISNDFQTYAERAAGLQQLAERIDDDGLKLQAHHCQWATCFHLGDHTGCLEHVRAGIELYADRDYRSHAARFGGHDPRVCALGETAQSLWLTGYPDQAQTEMKRARQWAEELKQSGSMVHIMDMNLLLLRYRCEPEKAAVQANELITFARENHFLEFSAKALVFKGWALAKSGDSGKGIEMMRNGINSHVLIGTNEDPPVWFEMLADCYFDAGDYQKGLDTMDDAFRHTERTGLRFWQAELHRRRGELLQKVNHRPLIEAKADFEEAIRISSEQGARSLLLRAAISLVRNAQLLGDSSDSKKLLAAIVNQFDEGLNTPDIQQAKALCPSMIDS